MRYVEAELHFYIFDVASDFELWQWGGEKGPHVSVKHVPHGNFSNEAVLRGSTYHQCMRDFAMRDHHTWITFLDIDEFMLFPNQPDVRIGTFLAHTCVRGLCFFPGRLFTSADRQLYQPLPVTKRFQFHGKLCVGAALAILVDGIPLSSAIPHWAWRCSQVMISLVENCPSPIGPAVERCGDYDELAPFSADVELCWSITNLGGWRSKRLLRWATQIPLPWLTHLKPARQWPGRWGVHCQQATW